MLQISYSERNFIYAIYLKFTRSKSFMILISYITLQIYYWLLWNKIEFTLNRFSHTRQVLFPLKIILFPPILNTPSVESFYIFGAKFCHDIRAAFVLSVLMMVRMIQAFLYEIGVLFDYYLVFCIDIKEIRLSCCWISIWYNTRKNIQFCPILEICK